MMIKKKKEKWWKQTERYTLRALMRMKSNRKMKKNEKNKKTHEERNKE